MYITSLTNILTKSFRSYDAATKQRGNTYSKCKSWTLICGVILFGVVVVGSLAGSSFYVSYGVASRALEAMATAYMETLPLYLQSAFHDLLGPIRIHVSQGLGLLQTKKANVATWAGISWFREYSGTFLKAYYKDFQGGFGVFANMGLSKEEVEPFGGWEQWLVAHLFDFGNPLAIFDSLLFDNLPNGEVLVTEARSRDYEGSLRNPVVLQYLDWDTLQDNGTGEFEVGFLNVPFVFGYTPSINPLSGVWRTVHRYDMQPGEFRFTPVSIYKQSDVHELVTFGVIPLYENVSLPTEAQLADLKAGKLSWGRRVGAWFLAYKMGSLSAYLASLNLKGGFVYLVDKESEILVATSDTAIPLLTDQKDYNKVAAIRARDVTHPLIKTINSYLAPSGDYSQVVNRITEATVGGADRFIMTFDIDFNGISFKGIYTIEKSVFFADLDNRIASDATMFIILDTVVLALGLVALFCWGRRKFLSLHKEHLEQCKARERRVLQAWTGATSCRFSMVLVQLDHFMQHGRILSYEQVLQKGQLQCLSDYTQVKNFVRVNETIFFSHQWLGWEDPDPKMEQYPLMVQAALSYAGLKLKLPHQVWIWVDRISIPQENDFMKLLAIESLHVYASSCNAFIIVAPPTVHQDTGMQVDFSTYSARGWCRLEEFSRLASASAVEGMFLCTVPGELEPVKEGDISQVLQVVGGSFTCCERGHPGGALCDKLRIADTLLGLYMLMGSGAEERSSDVFQLLKVRRAEIFSEEIFGDILQTADVVLAQSNSMKQPKLESGAADGIISQSCRLSVPSNNVPGDETFPI